MSMVLQAMVFDFDGTLARLTIDFGEMRRRVLVEAERFGFPPDGVDNLPVLEWIESTVARFGGDGRSGDAAFFAARAHAAIVDLEVESAASAELFEFTRPLLSDLRASGVKTAIITRNCFQAVRRVFPEVERACDVVLARDHTPRVKPDPAHLSLALERLGVRAEASAMVGDHPLDVATGLAAGAFTAGVASGKVDEAELARHGARLTAPDCRALCLRLRERGLLPDSGR